MEYGISQETYMDTIHIPDSKSKKWNDTLYSPIQNSIKNILDKDLVGNKNTMVYIGPGPDSPLFNGNKESNNIIGRFSKVILLDLSKKYLEKSKQTLEEKYKNTEFVVYPYDITHGLSNKFYNLVRYIISERDDYDIIIQLIDREYKTIINESNALYDILKNEKIDFAYSEMVATYTGVPSLYEYEKNTKSPFDDNKCLLDIWKYYNDKVATFHFENMLNLVSVDGLVSIVTDIEKIFTSEDKKIISVFSNGNPLKNINVFANKIFIDENILWDDTVRHDNEFLASIEPHLHRVGLYAYSR